MPGSDAKEKANPADHPPSSARDVAPVRAANFDPTEILSRIWQQTLPLMRERVACLERFARQADLGELTPAARIEASDLAHKLAGSLGMFGYPRGTEIAREMENMLEAETEPDPRLFLELAAGLRTVLAL